MFVNPTTEYQNNSYANSYNYKSTIHHNNLITVPKQLRSDLKLFVPRAKCVNAKF